MVADGIAHAGADGIASRSRALGSRRGLELWWHCACPAQKGFGPELVQCTVTDLLVPDRAASVAELQPALLRLKEQLRDAVAAGHPVDDMQRVVALRALLPKSRLGRLGDLEDTHPPMRRSFGRSSTRLSAPV